MIAIKLHIASSVFLRTAAATIKSDMTQSKWYGNVMPNHKSIESKEINRFITSLNTVICARIIASDCNRIFPVLMVWMLTFHRHALNWTPYLSNLLSVNMPIMMNYTHFLCFAVPIPSSIENKYQPEKIDFVKKKTKQTNKKFSHGCSKHYHNSVAIIETA